MAKNYVLIPAAGSGSRMGAELPKQYLPLLGKPMIHHTLSVFSAHPEVDRVYVVLNPDDALWPGFDHARVEVLHCGGSTRAASVLNGLNGLAGRVADDDWVLVHDAARPCLAREDLDALLHAVAEDAVGGLLAVPVADTLKRADQDNRVAATEPREGLWQAQTPQMFRYSVLRQALEISSGNSPTDEAQAIERMGLAPKLVLGSRNNLKVTFSEDLEMAGMILQARAAQ